MKKVFLIDYDLCSLNSCGQPCVKKCPISISNQRKKQHHKKDEIPIRYKKSTDNMIIIDEICIKCGICLNVCPRNAIYSIYLLDEPDDDLINHEYPIITDKLKTSSEPNEKNHGFRLYGLPTLISGKVTGLCGPNGIGKSTVLNILSGNLKMNFGNTKDKDLKWRELLKHVKESEMRQHFQETTFSRNCKRTTTYRL
ncbi:MAG: ATP-binding cassette domain-containing protein [Promethearchaeota archaeon]